MENDQKIMEVYDRCLNYLSYKNRTEHEMVSYMEKKGIDERVIAAVMQKLCHYDFVNDRNYVRNYCENNRRINFWGRYKMRWDLKKRGISENQLHWLEEDFPYEAEKRCCERQLQSALRKTAHESDSKRRSKIFNTLKRKGFGSDLIREVMDAGMLQPDPFDEAFGERISADQERLLQYYDKYERMQRRKGYEGRELKQRIIRNLMSRGYRYAEIEAAIRAREEEENEEDF